MINMYQLDKDVYDRFGAFHYLDMDDGSGAGRRTEHLYSFDRQFSVDGLKSHVLPENEVFDYISSVKPKSITMTRKTFINCFRSLSANLNLSEISQRLGTIIEINDRKVENSSALSEHYSKILPNDVIFYKL